jgi:hypothetical protein
MSITLEISPEVEASLVERANSIGVPLDKFLQRVVEREALVPVTKGRPLTGPEKAEAFRRWAMSFPPNLPVLNLEDITREKMYERDDSWQY